MFGIGKRGSIKRDTNRYIEETIRESDKTFRNFLQVIMQNLMNEGVEPILVEKIVNTASPSLVYLIALLSYELAIIRFKVNDNTEFGIIGSEYFKAVKRRLPGSTGEYVEGNVLDITHFVFTQFSQSEIEYDYVFKVEDEKNMWA